MYDFSKQQQICKEAAEIRPIRTTTGFFEDSTNQTEKN
jgi:hypothetical protein